MTKNSLTEYISQCYHSILHREPDAAGLSHYLREMMEGRLSKEGLVMSLKSSEEYALSNKPSPSFNSYTKIVDVTNLDHNELTSKLNEANTALLQDYLLNSTIVPGPKEELRHYVEDAFFRFIKTLQMIPVDATGKLLEMGSNPYFTTTLLKKFRKLDLYGANFFSTPDDSIVQTVFNEKYGEKFVYESKLFNIEKSIFPYPESTFDYVLFCEIIEHLVENPVHVLEQIFRILKPKGTIILTTPNVARASNIEKLSRGENIYDPYSKYGIYGRHNREYTIHELTELLSKTGFEVKMRFTKFVHVKKPDSNWWKLTDTDSFKGDYIFISATKKEKFEMYKPSWLFR